MKPLFLLAPGAGAPSSHPWLQRWQRRLDQIGRAITFDYDYMREGRRRPDSLPQLIATHRRVLADARVGFDGAVILAGKSMGGRIGCHVALEEKVSALVCFGYPLCAMGDPQKLRDRVLLELKTPVLFVQGTRDPLCPLDLLENVRRNMSAPNELHVVEGGDHSLHVRKRELGRSGRTEADIDEEILQRISGFVAELASS